MKSTILRTFWQEFFEPLVQVAVLLGLVSFVSTALYSSLGSLLWFGSSSAQQVLR